LLIHDMDRFDKHRELAVVVNSVVCQVNVGAFQTIRTVREPASGGLKMLGDVGPPNVRVYSELFAQVAFDQFREREDDPLVPFLENLFRFTKESVESFAGEFG
jgi:hypothetical protein